MPLSKAAVTAGSDRCAAPEKVHNQGDHGQNQEKVNQAAGHVESKEAQHPEHQENHKNRK
jgi:hypothetical protein